MYSRRPRQLLPRACAPRFSGLAEIFSLFPPSPFPVKRPEWRTLLLFLPPRLGVLIIIFLIMLSIAVRFACLSLYMSLKNTNQDSVGTVSAQINQSVSRLMSPDHFLSCAGLNRLKQTVFSYLASTGRIRLRRTLIFSRPTGMSSGTMQPCLVQATQRHQTLFPFIVSLGVSHAMKAKAATHLTCSGVMLTTAMRRSVLAKGYAIKRGSRVCSSRQTALAAF